MCVKLINIIKVIIEFFFFYFYDLNTRTTRTTFCRHMGHSASCLPHLIHDTMWPQSRRTQSMIDSMQILHKSTSPDIGSKLVLVRVVSRYMSPAELELAAAVAPPPVAVPSALLSSRSRILFS